MEWAFFCLVVFIDAMDMNSVHDYVIGCYLYIIRLLVGGCKSFKVITEKGPPSLLLCRGRILESTIFVEISGQNLEISHN